LRRTLDACTPAKYSLARSRSSGGATRGVNEGASWNRTKLVSVYIKDGSPLDGPYLCESCTHGFVTRGYRECEATVVCQASYPDRRVAFRVRECSHYVNRISKTLKEMEEIAWVLPQKGSKRNAGFLGPNEDPQDKDKLELIWNRQE